MTTPAHGGASARVDDRFPGLAFHGNPLDRRSERRDDAAFLDALFTRADAQTVLIAGDVPALGGGGTPTPFHAVSQARALPCAEVALLGLRESGAPVFATLLADEAIAVEGEKEATVSWDTRRVVVRGRPDIALRDLRSLAAEGVFGPEDTAILAQAKALMHWHARHRFCSNCGAKTRLAAAGWRRECDGCRAQHFPRTDPVAIMLATDGERCLLGRQARFPRGMYSALAGFVESGETIEEAARRELFEEAGVRVSSVAYLASQPWPFPMTLMIGCIARAETRELTIDRTELEDARWFSREEIRAVLEKRHPDGVTAPQPIAIAHHLITAWALHGASA
ncbi:MAG: NAD(+) diphosphatase [Methylobacteriaceae bacterium]|nr:NAD(+) diphosphatase [Methylobacteriaceae bacterium]